MDKDQYDEQTERLLKDKILALRNASHDCGSWEDQDQNGAPYGDFTKAANIAEVNLLLAVAAALREIGKERDELRREVERVTHDAAPPQIRVCRLVRGGAEGVGAMTEFLLGLFVGFLAGAFFAAWAVHGGAERRDNKKCEQEAASERRDKELGE